jgi:Ca2+-binding RTX toxin-like protein
MRLLSACIIATLGLAAPAHAATVEVTAGPQPKLTYRAGPGETNALIVRLDGTAYKVQDTGATITPGTGCNATDAQHATCAAGGVTALFVALGDLNDAAGVDAALPAELDGGDGNDLLVGGSGADRLDGGPGFDLLDGDTGADVMRGGDGPDIASYLFRSDPLVLKIDGAADSGSGLDGPAGARDEIDHDIEILLGGAGNDGLTGDAGDNTLYGGDGADVLTGGDGFDMVDYSDRAEPVAVAIDGTRGSGGTADGPAGARDTVATDIEGIFGGDGNDTLSGGPLQDYLVGNGGDDVLDSRGGDADFSDCGDGRDTAFLDLGVDGYLSCETVNPVVAPAATPTPAPAPAPALDRTPPRTVVQTARQTLTQALAHGLSLRVSCSEDCAVDAQLTAGPRAAKALGLAKSRRRVTVARGSALMGGAVVLRFTAKARRRLAHARRVTLSLVVHARDANGNLTTVRRSVTLTRSGVTLAARLAALSRRIRVAPAAAPWGR